MKRYKTLVFLGFALLLLTPTAYALQGNSTASLDNYLLRSEQEDLNTLSNVPLEPSFFTEAQIVSNGTLLVVSGYSNNNETLYGFTMSDQYNVSSLTGRYDNKTFTRGNPRTETFEFVQNGSKLYRIDQDPNRDSILYEYSLSTPYNVSTASYSGRNITLTFDSGVVGLHVTNSGEKAYFLDDGTNVLYEYNFSDPYNISSLVQVRTGLLGQESYRGFDMSLSGEYFVTTDLDTDGENIKLFNLSTPYSVDNTDLMSTRDSYQNSLNLVSASFSKDDTYLLQGTFEGRYGLYQYNNPPMLLDVPTQTRSIDTGEAYGFNVTSTDFENDTVTYGLNDTNFLSINSTTGRINGSYNDSGTYTYTLNASDTDGFIDTYTFTHLVSNPPSGGGGGGGSIVRPLNVNLTPQFENVSYSRGGFRNEEITVTNLESRPLNISVRVDRQSTSPKLYPFIGLGGGSNATIRLETSGSVTSPDTFVTYTVETPYNFTVGNYTLGLVFEGERNTRLKYQANVQVEQGSFEEFGEVWSTEVLRVPSLCFVQGDDSSTCSVGIGTSSEGLEDEGISVSLGFLVVVVTVIAMVYFATKP